MAARLDLVAWDEAARIAADRCPRSKFASIHAGIVGFLFAGLVMIALGVLTRHGTGGFRLDVPLVFLAAFVLPRGYYRAQEKAFGRECREMADVN